ncbi:MAG: hypothetical protein QNJ97_23040 [Myxococcota bacterium]|nr:hypothetical protein [Myxococcota bacterium]
MLCGIYKQRVPLLTGYLISLLYSPLGCGGSSGDSGTGADTETASSSDSSSDVDTGSEMDAGIDTDTGTDTGTDTESDTGSDSSLDGGQEDGGEIEDMCEAYPPSNDNFALHSVIRNYLFWDKNDDQMEVCEFAKDYDLLLMRIAVDGCVTSQQQIPKLVELSQKYKEYGVVIIDVVQVAFSAGYLQFWVGEYNFPAFRTDPANQVVKDFETTLIVPGCGTYTLVNLTNMKVNTPICGTSILEAEACIQAALAK